MGSIEYTLVRNETMVDQEQCVAQVRPTGTVNVDGLVDFMMQTATVSKPDVLGVLEGFFNAIEFMLLDGKNVVTPVAVYRTSIQGIFTDEADAYDPARHRLSARASIGARLRKAILLRAKVEKVLRSAPNPLPLRFVDTESGSSNDLVTPGGDGRVLGAALRFDPDDPRQGVFFVATDGSEVRARKPARNMPTELIFVIPPLPAGEYQMQVRTAANEEGKVNAGVLDRKLTVR